MNTTLKRFCALVLVLLSIKAGAQFSFNQYNGALGQINPALLVHVDRDQFSVLGRNQWPGLKNGMAGSVYAFNKFFARINSSIGVYGKYAYGTQSAHQFRSEGIQYSWRIMLLERYFICTGIGVEHSTSTIDLNDIHPLFEPKAIYPVLPQRLVNSETFSTSYGLAFYDLDMRNYVGFSIRQQPLKLLNEKSSAFAEDLPSFSLHGLYHKPITREATLMLFAEIARTGGTQYVAEGGAAATLIPSSMYYFIQANIFKRNAGVIGFGYKYFSKNYGCLNFRVIPWANLTFALGYSFDAKPYIQYDKIHFIASHELLLKIRFPSKQ
jgi:hypothetical protein